MDYRKPQVLKIFRCLAISENILRYSEKIGNLSLRDERLQTEDIKLGGKERNGHFLYT